MDDIDLRKKIEDLGKGSFDRGIEKLSSSFIGTRRHLGVNTRFRTRLDSVETIMGEGLASNIPDSLDFLTYLIKQPIRYESVNQEIKVSVREDSRRCFSGYTLSRVVNNTEEQYREK